MYITGWNTQRNQLIYWHYTGRITAAESLFWYDVNDNYNSFQDMEWVPYFTTGAVPSIARQLCGSNDECLRDYFITQNAALAAATASASDSAKTTADTLCE